MDYDITKIAGEVSQNWTYFETKFYNINDKNTYATHRYSPLKFIKLEFPFITEIYDDSFILKTIDNDEFMFPPLKDITFVLKNLQINLDYFAGTLDVTYKKQSILFNLILDNCLIKKGTNAPSHNKIIKDCEFYVM